MEIFLLSLAYVVGLIVVASIMFYFNFPGTGGNPDKLDIAMTMLLASLYPVLIPIFVAMAIVAIPLYFIARLPIFISNQFKLAKETKESDE